MSNRSYLAEYELLTRQISLRTKEVKKDQKPTLLEGFVLQGIATLLAWLFFVFSVEFRFRVDADWSRSCAEIAGLWTHVHSFPLAAFDGCVGFVLFGFAFAVFGFLLFSAACACTITVAPERLIGIFWVRRRNFSWLLLQCTVLICLLKLATAITLSRAPAN